MPTPKRWHPVSRDLNDDHEVWELTDMFGDRALRIHLEILATLDRTENLWIINGHALAGLSRKARQQPTTVRRVIGWMLEKGWLIAEEVAADGFPTILRARNYWKYHKMREPRGANLGTDKEHKRSPDRAPSYPNLPFLREEKIRGGVDKVDNSARIVSTVGNQSKPDAPMTPILATLESMSPTATSNHFKERE